MAVIDRKIVGGKYVDTQFFGFNAEAFGGENDVYFAPTGDYYKKRASTGVASLSAGSAGRAEGKSLVELFDIGILGLPTTTVILPKSNGGSNIAVDSIEWYHGDSKDFSISDGTADVIILGNDENPQYRYNFNEQDIKSTNTYLKCRIKYNQTSEYSYDVIIPEGFIWVYFSGDYLNFEDRYNNYSSSIKYNADASKHGAIPVTIKTQGDYQYSLNTLSYDGSMSSFTSGNEGTYTLYFSNAGATLSTDLNIWETTQSDHNISSNLSHVDTDLINGNSTSISSLWSSSILSLAGMTSNLSQYTHFGISKANIVSSQSEEVFTGIQSLGDLLTIYSNNFDTLFGFSKLLSNKINTIDSVFGLTDDDNATIDKLSEIISWFNNLPESDRGALDLVNRVGTLEGYNLDNRVTTLENYDLDSRVTLLEGFKVNGVSSTKSGTNKWAVTIKGGDINNDDESTTIFTVSEVSDNNYILNGSDASTPAIPLTYNVVGGAGSPLTIKGVFQKLADLQSTTTSALYSYIGYVQERVSKVEGFKVNGVSATVSDNKWGLTVNTSHIKGSKSTSLYSYTYNTQTGVLSSTSTPLINTSTSITGAFDNLSTIYNNSLNAILVYVGNEDLKLHGEIGNVNNSLTNITVNGQGFDPATFATQPAITIDTSHIKGSETVAFNTYSQNLTSRALSSTTSNVITTATTIQQAIANIKTIHDNSFNALKTAITDLQGFYVNGQQSTFNTSTLKWNVTIDADDIKTDDINTTLSYVSTEQNAQTHEISYVIGTTPLTFDESDSTRTARTLKETIYILAQSLTQESTLIKDYMNNNDAAIDNINTTFNQSSRWLVI